MAPSTRHVTLADIGEFGLIAELRGLFPVTPAVLLGSGDDAAVVAAPDGRMVATTDLLVEGRHFRLDWSSPRDVGHKAAAQNLSDLAAMGARPTALLVGLGAPPSLPVDVALEIAAGIAAECAQVGATVVGGDVVSSPTLLLAVTALGELDGRAPVRRDGAQVGDRIVVVGTLGGSAAGLAAFRAGFTGVEVAALLDAHRRPTPPYDAGPALADVGATSLIDTSDGFAADLGHVLAASGVGGVVDCAALPAHPALSSGWARDQGAGAVGSWLLSGGEDHALVATLPPRRLPDLAEALDRLGLAWAEVGEVTGPAPVRWLNLPDGVDEPGGFDHFGTPR